MSRATEGLRARSQARPSCHNLSLATSSLRSATSSSLVAPSNSSNAPSPLCKSLRPSPLSRHAATAGYRLTGTLSLRADLCACAINSTQREGRSKDFYGGCPRRFLDLCRAVVCEHLPSSFCTRLRFFLGALFCRVRLTDSPRRSFSDIVHLQRSNTVVRLHSRTNTSKHGSYCLIISSNG